MAQIIADRRDIDFVLYEQLDTEDLTRFPKYSEFNRKLFDMTISEARNFGIKEILPTFSQGDRDGVRLEAGKVIVSESFRKPHRLYVEGEWIAMKEDPAVGGQGLPHIVAQAASEYLVGANFAFTAFGTLGHGAGKLVELYGTAEQKALYLRHLYSGKWGGTMLLTESGAGSDLGALTTTAIKNTDGTYSIAGNKIFITNGDQNLTENIIHPVLARIEGAPKGAKGISLFIVPKIWVNDDGSFGDFNDVVCTGVEEKLGLHGSPTCSLTLGAKGKCRGVLLGEENKGMQVMFHMMNEARLDVGAQGFTHGSSAYLYALNYARERLQGKDITAGADSPQVPIIRHPDVRRMLIQMKAYTDGMRSFIYYVSRCFDMEACASTAEEKNYYAQMTELLTPVVKAYCSERGFDVCTLAVQVYGGYGFTREYPVEQLLRDCKITSIYEGTNGIQAMDLLGRKLMMKKGAAFQSLISEMESTVLRAAAVPGLADMAEAVKAAISGLNEIAAHLAKAVMSDRVRAAFAASHPFLEIMGDVIMGWMLLWRASVAAPKLEKIAANASGEALEAIIESNRQAAFYDGQLKTAAYFIYALLPITAGKIQALKKSRDEVIQISEKSFGGL
jgi:alkylation response protein AidB-like acyl-CoA dehydrogenase